MNLFGGWRNGRCRLTKVSSWRLRWFRNYAKKSAFCLPEVIERICALAITRANRIIYLSLTEMLDDDHRTQLEGLLPQLSTPTPARWLGYDSRPVHRTPSTCSNTLIGSKPSKRSISRKQAAPSSPESVAETGSRRRPNDRAAPAGPRTERRYATLVAVVLETKATLIDQIVDLHDRMIGALFNRAKRATQSSSSSQRKAINEKLRLYWRIGDALLEAKRKRRRTLSCDRSRSSRGKRSREA